MNSVTHKLQPKRITNPVSFLMGLEDGQDWGHTVYDGYSFFAGKSLAQYETGFMLGRQALKRRESKRKN